MYVHNMYIVRKVRFEGVFRDPRRRSVFSTTAGAITRVVLHVVSFLPSSARRGGGGGGGHFVFRPQ